MKHKELGFTLLELMMVLTVIGIIVAIALPTFNQQIRKSRRSEVISLLQSMTLEQEKYRSSHSSYATLAQLQATMSTTATHYDISVTLNATPAIGYTVTATAKAGDSQNSDRNTGGGGGVCTPLNITSLNGTQTKDPSGCFQ
jgi:type IV pilus assembly protein PilE